MSTPAPTVGAGGAELSQEFLLAGKHFEAIYKECTDTEKLKMYALYNQAVNGDITEKEPSATQIVKRAKYNARKKLVGMNSVQAQKRYVSELRRIDPSWKGGESDISKDVAKQAEIDAELAPQSVAATAASASSGGLSSLFNRKSTTTKPPPISGFRQVPPTDNKTFEKASQYAQKSGIFRDDTNRTFLYAYYKQATVGPCDQPAPFFASRIKYARWRAWCDLSDMSKDEAKAHYVARVKKVAGAAFTSDQPPAPAEIVVTAHTLRAQANEATLAVASSMIRTSAKPLGPISDSADDIAKACAAAHAAGGIVYLITGATGFIGKHLMERLLNRNVNSIIFTITRGSSIKKLNELCKQRYGPVHGSRVVGIKGDITAPMLGLDAARLKAFTGGVDHMFHIAAVYDMKASEEMNNKTNVGGTREAVKVGNQIGAKIFQHTSSIAVAGDYDGLFYETMFAEGQTFDQPYLRTKYESEAIVRAECKVPWRVYRPGIVIGSSKTGEADKIDGIAYLYKPIQQCRKWLPQNLVLPCIEGETQPIVPVDYVADAMDALAHMKGLDGRAFHLVDPSPPTLVELMNIFAKAAHAPQYSSRFATVAMALIPKKVWSAISGIPIIESAPNAVTSAVLGVPESVIAYASWRAQFDNAETLEALSGTGITCPPLASYAWKCWDYYERFLDLRNIDRPRALYDEIAGKTVVITGASDGIGARLAERLAEQGAKVILVSRSMDKLKEVGDKIRKSGGDAKEYVADLSKGDDCVKVCQEITKAHGAVDILVNNAGRSIRRSVEYQCSPDRFHDFVRCIELNYYGPVRMICGLLPGMRAKKEGQIINISSVGVVTNAARFSAYVASKAAMDGFSRCIGGEIHGDNVSITTIYMPLVATKMVVSKGNKYDHLNLLTTDEACEMIERSIVTKERVIMTGTARLINVAYQLFPTLIESLLHRQYKLEPEAPPTGQAISPSAAGDKEQLRALGALLRGGTMAEAMPSEN